MSASDARLDEKLQSVQDVGKSSDHGMIGCYVALTLRAGRYWIVADSVEEFKRQAIEQRGTNPDEDFWDDANLICPKDGCRIQDMDALQRCVTKNGHNIFYLVGPNAPTFSDISLDIEWMAELYEDLTRDTTKMDQKLRLWTRTRLRETEALCDSYSPLLALKVKKDIEEVMAVKEKIFMHLKASERSFSESDADSSF